MADTSLNLYNFEDEDYADSRYVLTSPRSLQSCDMLGVQPASLLYKPLSDFQDELLTTGLPLRAIYDRYDEHEKSRQKKLRECRDYRDKLIRDAMYSRMSPLPSYCNQYEDAGYKSDDSMTRLSSAFNKNDYGGVGSLQRQRTAKVIGHQLSSRSTSPIIARPHSACAVPSYTENLPARPRSNTPTRSVSFTNNLYKQQSVGRGNKARSRNIRSAWRSPSPSRAVDSCVDLTEQLSKSLCLSDLSTWRPSHLHGTHIKNKCLRRSLGYSNSSGRITHQDEKILEALHNKNVGESEQELNRSMAQLEWEEQKLRLQRDKEIAEHRRRQLLAERIAESERRQAMLREKARKDEEELRQSMMSRYEESETRWRRGSERQQYKKDLAKTHKRRQSRERKLEQERLLAEFEEQREKQLTNHRQRVEQQERSAVSAKDTKYYVDKSKKHRQNAQEMERHRKRLRELQRACSKYNQDMRTSINSKHNKSIINQSRVAKARDYSLHINAKERQQKFERSKKNLQQKEEEMSEWKRSLKARRRLLESKAKLTASQTIELKALKAQAEREEREMNQRRSYSRLQEEAEVNRRDQKDAILYKDTKMKLVEHHKGDVISKMRSMAATSQRMREELRKKYGKDSFAKVAFETELQNKIGQGRLSATKNKSTVLLA